MYDVVLFTENTDPVMISLPLGAYKLASVLRKHSYKTLVVNQFSWFSLPELIALVDRVITDNTLVVGFSTSFLHNVRTDEHGRRHYSPMTDISTVFPHGKDVEDAVISHIKKINPNIKVTVGGTKASPAYSNTNIDYVFLGYSETSIIHLMSHLTKGDVIPKSYVNQNGITIIDDRTAPNYDFTNDMMVWEETDVVNYKVLPIEIGRGCIFRCKFCAFPLNGKKTIDYNKDSEVLYQELLDAYEKFGVTHFMIVDDTFNDHIDKLIAIEKAVKRLPFQPKFWCYARLDLLCTNEGMIDIMHSIGVRSMLFGIETLDREAGRIIGKGYDRQKQINMIHYIRETYPDISIQGNFIAGLPHESLDSIKMMLQQLESGDIPLHSWVIKSLHIIDPDVLSFNSDLSLNYSNYGYEITENRQGILHWKNEFTTFLEVDTLANECMLRSRQKPYYYVSGYDGFELVNFGYDLNTTISTPFTDFRWDIVKSGVVEDFVTEYKQKFNQLLNAQVVER